MMTTDFCQACGYGLDQQEGADPSELLWTDDDQALCVLCALELVRCACGESIQRLDVQFTAGGDVCLACAWAPADPVWPAEQLAA